MKQQSRILQLRLENGEIDKDEFLYSMANAQDCDIITELQECAIFSRFREDAI